MAFGPIQYFIKKLNKQALICTIIPFFLNKKHLFLSEKKKRDFARFRKMINLIYQGNKSTTYQDVTTLLELIKDVEAQKSRKYTDKEILDRAADFWAKNQEKIKAKNQTTL